MHHSWHVYFYEICSCYQRFTNLQIMQRRYNEKHFPYLIMPELITIRVKYKWTVWITQLLAITFSLRIMIMIIPAIIQVLPFIVRSHYVLGARQTTVYVYTRVQKVWMCTVAQVVYHRLRSLACSFICLFTTLAQNWYEHLRLKIISTGTGINLCLCWHTKVMAQKTQNSEHFLISL